MGGQGMKIAICEDLAKERQIIREYLARFEREHSIEYSTDEYETGESLLLGINSNPANIIFLTYI